jgi:hypothetical protein
MNLPPLIEVVHRIVSLAAVIAIATAPDFKLGLLHSIHDCWPACLGKVINLAKPMIIIVPSDHLFLYPCTAEDMSCIVQPHMRHVQAHDFPIGPSSVSV